MLTDQPFYRLYLEVRSALPLNEEAMKQLEAMLNPAHFLRIHRSTIVNTAGITAAQPLNNGEYLLTLEGKTQLKVSRGYRDRVKQLLEGG